MVTIFVHPCFRFYNRPPEVRRKHEEETRAKVYATNRERAKQYQEVGTLLMQISYSMANYMYNQTDILNYQRELSCHW